MRIKEEYIVPALGAIVLLSVFGFATSGLSLIYPVLLGILGLAAVGTFFLPPAVQVEVRIAIAALGLIILIFYFSSVSFWLALLAFGAIGASQIRHGSVLTMPPHTVAYVKALLEKQGAAGAEVAGSGGDGSGEADQTGAAAPGSAAKNAEGGQRRRHRGLAMLARIRPAHWVAVGAGVVVFAAQFLEWASVDSRSVSESLTGIESSDGVIALISSLVALGGVALHVAGRRIIGGLLVLLLGGLVALVGIVDWSGVSDLSDSYAVLGILAGEDLEISVGPGLVLTTIAGVVLMGAGIWLLARMGAYARMNASLTGTSQAEAADSGPGEDDSGTALPQAGRGAAFMRDVLARLSLRIWLLLLGLAAVIVLLPLLLLFGVGGGGGGGGSAENLIRMLSGDAEGVLYVDVAALEDDDDLSDLRRSVESDWDFDSYDIDLRNLDYMAYAEEDGGGDVFLLGGVDDRDLRDELDDRGYDDEIDGVEVWVDSSSTWEAFAFLPGGGVLIAYYEEDMEDMLRRRDRGGSSLDDEMGDVWRDLPSGYLRVGLGAGNCDDTWDGCEAAGVSLEKENSREGKLVMLVEFDSERDAERAEDDIEDDWFDRDDCDDLAVSQSGSRVRAEVVCDLDEFDSFGDYGSGF